MNRRKPKLIVTGVALACVVLLSAESCEGSTPVRDQQLEESQSRFDDRTPPDVSGDAEYQNYMRAQEDVYDNPANILWCTFTWGNASAPLVTVPVAGKLTSSSVSYFPNETVETQYEGTVLLEAQSVDGMYHGSPPPYRYGFTPGGQYVDFFNLPTFCTTALTEFQRQVTEVSITTAEIDSIQEQAEAALADGDPAEAQRLLETIELPEEVVVP